MTRTPAVTAEQDAHRRLGEHLLAVVRSHDAAVPAHRRAPRTVAEMRARLMQAANDACPLCGRWMCDPSNCPPASAASVPVPATASGGWQCSVCGGWFGVTTTRPAPATAWTCAACAAGR